MKAIEYNSMVERFRMRNFLMKQHRFRMEEELTVFSIEIEDRDGDKVFFLIPAINEREMMHSARRMFRGHIIDIKELWKIKQEHATENEQMLIEHGFLASDEPIMDESEIKF